MGLPNIGPLELIIILAIALLIVGPGKLPEMGSAFGRTIREFRKASTDLGDATKPLTTPNTLSGEAQVQPNTLSTGTAIPATAEGAGAIPADAASSTSALAEQTSAAPADAASPAGAVSDRS